MPPLTLKGIVTKAGFMNKTVTVTVTRPVVHKLTRKRVNHRKKFLVHDEGNALQQEDEVQIVACRKLSARKNFTLDRILHSPQTLLEKARAIRAEEMKARSEAAARAQEEEERRTREAEEQFDREEEERERVEREQAETDRRLGKKGDVVVEEVVKEQAEVTAEVEGAATAAGEVNPDTMARVNTP